MQSSWQSGVLDPQGPVAAAERTIIFNASIIMLAVIVPIMVAIVVLAWWFRAGNTRARRLPDWSYSGRVELVVWSVPALIVIFLSGKMQIKLNRRTILGAIVPASLWVMAPPAFASSYPPIKAYRNPGCGCCEKWATLLKQAGFDITMEDDPNLEARRIAAGVPPAIAGCHTAYMGDCIIEGHVPVEDIKRFLSEKPYALGLAVPGMPAESPGMENAGQAEAFKVLAFKANGTWIEFSSHG